MAEFARTKPHLNVGTIGHVDHGKTTTTAAILKVAAAAGLIADLQDVDALDKAPESKTRGITIATAHVESQGATPHRGVVFAVIIKHGFSSYRRVVINYRSPVLPCVALGVNKPLGSSSTTSSGLNHENIAISR